MSVELFKLTNKQYEALNVFAQHDPLTVGAFAERMWPNSKARDTGLNMPGGRMVRQLKNLCLLDSIIDRGMRFTLSSLGWEVWKRYNETKDGKLNE